MKDTRTNSRWSQDRRLEFIDFRLMWDGRLNRSDLTDYFGISIPQASLDIAKYTQLAPANLHYNRSLRIYVATEAFRPLFQASLPGQYLNDLVGAASGILDAQSHFLGWTPPIDCVQLPGRALEEKSLKMLVQAIRESSGLEIRYQSMSSPEPIIRTITPHAFGFDGFRWHVRAFCHLRQEFRDFVLGRILEVLGLRDPGTPGAADAEWHTIVQLEIVPHAGLSPSMRKAIEVDFGMTDGVAVLECRRALLFYTLRQLGLDNVVKTPEAQQIELRNREQLAPYLR